MNMNLLRGKIAENRMTIADVASKAGMAYTTMYRKMSGETQFTTDEAIKLCDILNVSSDEEKCRIFLSK